MFPETLASLRRRRRRRHKKLLAAFVCAEIGVHVHEMDERAAASYARSLIRSAFRATYVHRCDALLESEWVTIFRMKRSSMENLRNKLYPYLAVHLSELNVEGRSHGNRRPLSVDEKLGIGLMTAGGCSMAGILQGYHVGKAAAYNTIWKFFVAVVESEVGRIYFPDTLYELQRKADEFLKHRGNLRLYHGCVGALDGLAVRIPLPSKNECEHPLSYDDKVVVEDSNNIDPRHQHWRTIRIVQNCSWCFLKNETDGIAILFIHHNFQKPSVLFGCKCCCHLQRPRLRNIAACLVLSIPMKIRQ